MSTELRQESDQPISDPEQEAQAQYLIRQIIRTGQRLCAIMGEDKRAWPIATLHDPANAACRNFIRLHVLNAPATFKVCFVENPEEIVERGVDRLSLGIYYGGTETLIGDGLNKTSSFALDVDKSDHEDAVLKALKTPAERKQRREETRNDPTWQQAETARLEKMLAEARRVFPMMRFFRKANGRFHGHANLDLPLDALLVKKWARSKLPPMLAHVEVFPKCADDADLKGYYVGNQVRLPFNPACPYVPIDGFEEIIAYRASEIVKEAAPISIWNAKCAAVDHAPLADHDVEFAAETYMGVGREDRMRRYGSYLNKYPPAISGNRGHDRLLLAAARRFDFGVAADDAIKVLSDYSLRCEPPWSEKELRHKVKDARPSDGFKPGCKLTDELGFPTNQNVAEPQVPDAPTVDTGLPDFPLDIFPEDVRAVIQTVSWVTQTPPEVAAQSVLAILSLACSRAGVSVQWKPGVVEPTNLYLVTALMPSEHKSSALKPLLAPMRRFQSLAGEEAGRRLSKHEAESIRLEGKIEEARRAISKRSGNSVQAESLESLIEQKRELKPPIIPRYLLDDITPEQLGTILKDNGAAGMISTEAGIIDNMSGRYSPTGEGQINPYLKMWDGEPFHVDRRGRSEEVRGYLTIGCACQPAALRRLVSVVKGARNLGLLSRFLFAIPHSRVGTRSVDDDGLDQAALSAWSKRVESTLNLKPAMLALCAEAREELRSWRAEIEQRLVGDLREIADWGGKLQAGQPCRIAGILHSCWNPGSCEVSSDTMRLAISLCRYYIAHAKAVFASMEQGEHAEMAEKIVAWAAGFQGKDNQKKDLPARTFFLRHAQRRFSKDKSEMEPVLAYMVEVGTLRQDKKLYVLAETAISSPPSPLTRPTPMQMAITLPETPKTTAIPPTAFQSESLDVDFDQAILPTCDTSTIDCNDPGPEF